MGTKRQIIVGDVHGCYAELCRLLDKVCFDPSNDHLILLGDLINKGPSSKECYEFATLTPSVTVLMGNHEKGFAQAYLEGTLHQYESFMKMAKNWKKSFTKEVAHWCRNLPYTYDHRNFFVVHAGINPLKGFKNTSKDEMSRIRTLSIGEKKVPWHERYAGKRPIIYGHWATQGLKLKSNSIGLDSGCVYGGQLSAYILPEKKLFQVQAQETYLPID
ncbi:hypothetical protein GW915_04205 [bacterium]|nr:hypothetical protein [bacterium]